MLLEASQRPRHLGPGIETVPSQIEVTRRILGEPGDAEARQDALEVAPVQHVELAECTAPAAHLFHRRLVPVTPGVGKCEPVEHIAEWLEYLLGLSGNARAPVHESAEHVKEKRSDILHAGSMPFARNTLAAAG